MNRTPVLTGVIAALTLLLTAPGQAQIAVRGKKIYTSSGVVLTDGVVVLREGKIAEIGPANKVVIPAGFTIVDAAVVTPGLVDIRGTVGLTGIYNNFGHDQDQLETSAAMQPELRALDAYNPQEKLVAYVRGFGVTTVNTGHAPGRLISGQSVIVKTTGNTVEEALMVETGAVLADMSSEALQGSGSPGTRAKVMSLLRQQFLAAQRTIATSEAEAKKVTVKAPGKTTTTSKPAATTTKTNTTATNTPASKTGDGSPRDLRQEMFVRILKREIPLMITAHRAQDIASALRLAREFRFRLILDGASDAPLLLEEIKAAGVPIALHPTMQRAFGDTQNLSFETAAKLKKAGIPFAIETGFEAYVPKVRVLLFEAAVAAANGLSTEEALSAITIDAARILGIEKRVGSLEVGKDGDVALYDGDPFEYLTHCTGTIIQGRLVSSDRN